MDNQFEDIYKNIPEKNVPWNMEKPPHVLKELLRQKVVLPCKTLEIGCGFGNHALYISGLGFEVTGVDRSDTAVKKANENALRKNAACKFIVADILGGLYEISETFDFIFDWLVLHHIFPEQRKLFAEVVHGLLNPGGKYLSVCFSEADTAFEGCGKYRETPIGTTLYFSSEEEIAQLFSPYFKIKDLKTVEIEGRVTRHTSIYALLEK